MMVDITKKPFNLNNTQCNWVYARLAEMSLEEKVGQLFLVIDFSQTDEQLLDAYRKIPFGGVMYRPGDSQEIHCRNTFIQSKVKIPLLIAANLEAGGSGLAADGTLYGSQLQVAATNDSRNARTLGRICGREAAAIGANLAFAPVVDIDRNWRNPITNTRTFGSDPDHVLEFASEYLVGIKPHQVAVTLKHFPGDGVDERDQHVLTSVNSLSCEEWDATDGKIYASLIAQGAQVVMTGHISQPAYTRHFNPEITDEDIMPASMSPELIGGLLRGRLGFNGVVITDAANMAGMCCAKPRKEVPAAAINAGNDMFLFGRNVQEDYQNLLEAVKSGILPVSRLDEAVTRILALKASLGLDQLQAAAAESSAEIVGCEDHRKLAEDCADQSVTLVKDSQQLLPVSPEKHPRVWLFILGDEVGFTGGWRCKDTVISELERAGFQVTYFDKDKASMLDSQVPVSELRQQYDLIMYFANVSNASYKTVNRISWSSTVGVDAPYYVKDIPTLFVSLGNPYHFIDVPMIRTIVNAYTASQPVIRAVMDKLTGQSDFKGVSPVDPFCGVWGANI
jgi:beta-N-acetylhexosaminidase